ncbi:DNA polymerase eta-like [Montipora capricornis]|uniref:DNA polymerase eta-like n=1 Tax=Montipora capricornis TaxID=246305 RepID=UPI0035F1750F
MLTPGPTRASTQLRSSKSKKYNQNYNQRVMDVEMGTFTPLVFGTKGGMGRVKYWLEQLASELHERLAKESELNNGEAKLLGVGFKTESNTSFTRSCHLKDSSAVQIAKDLYNLLVPFNSTKDKKTNIWYPEIVVINISASKFEEISQNSTPSIRSFLNKKTCTEVAANAPNDEVVCSLLSAGESVENVPSSGLQVGYENRGIQFPGINNETEDSTRDVKTASNCKVRNNDPVNKKGIEAFFPTAKRIQRVCEGNATTHTKTVNLTAPFWKACRIAYSAKFKSFLKNKNQVELNEEEACFGSPASSPVKDSASGLRLNTQAERSNASDGPRDSYDNEAEHSNAELVKCEKCSLEFSPWHMPEHSDYHFAVELQRFERSSAGASSFSAEPPKKKQRTTIESFFSPK